MIDPVVLQIVITVLLSGAASWVGVISGTAVMNSKMMDFDRRLTGIEMWKDKFTEQQVELYQSRLRELERQLTKSEVS